MGVNGLWQVLQPCARPTNLATLNRKRLAVDASIWIYQFLKAVRDKEGNALRNSHVVGFFRRICKLLWFGILPVFVFDGGAPALKRSTLQARRQRREGRREDAVRTAGKLLAVQMQRIAEEDAEKRRKRARERGPQSAVGAGDEDGLADGEVLPSADKIVYAEEMHKPEQERLQARKFTKKDAYHLPDLDRPIEGMGRPEDPRIMSIDELEEYARQFHAGEDINLYDFSKIDFDGDFFKSLPPADRYYILNAARIRSRLRMGLSKEQLDTMFPDRMAFSRFQIERVRERNHLTQRLMIEAGMTGIDLTMGVNGRVAGEKDREYILVKNEGAEGGWALGVVSRDKEQGQVHKPIDVDALQFRYDGDKEEDSEDDEWADDVEFQDVPIEGLNRLPKPSSSQRDVQTTGGNEGEEDSLFVSSYQPADSLPTSTAQEAGGEADELMDDEEGDLHKAIAMSLRSQHVAGVSEGETDEDENEMFEDVDIPAPEWTQKAAEAAPKPIMATSGRMVAHIVNNRSNAAVSASKAQATNYKQNSNDGKDSDSSDSELDIRAAMAAAAKQRKKSTGKGTAQAESIRPQTKNPFAGPLPFEQLDWKTSIFEKRPVAEAPSFAAMASASTANAANAAAATGETGSLEADSDDDGLAGGFVVEADEVSLVSEGEDDDLAIAAKGADANDSAPRPLPPWIADATDIRTAIRQQKAYDNETNAEDREMALEEEQMWQRQQEPQIVEIDSSSDSGSDVEIVEAPRAAQQPEAAEQEALEQDTLEQEEATADITVPEPQREVMEIVDVAESRSSSPEMVFEDVELPERPAATEEMQPEADAGKEVAKVVAVPLDDDGLFTGEGDDVFDISDPEEEELLAQMAEEAEEHARFASTLNHKTGRESQAAFEQELKALRNQQKKDRRDADEVTLVMVSECQALLRLFGIPYITAPMEAEAQCSELVSLGLVDGIVTDDSDTFLFGGTRVYKNMFNGNKFVECFLAADLEKEMSLSREKLISIAQLLGSDYTDGLPGVGPVTAMEILSEFPGPRGLEEFRAWWDDVQMYGRSNEADAGSPFRRKFRKSQGTKLFLPTGFPNSAVATAYEKPEVDKSAEPFQWGVPNLDGLRRFLTSTIGWSQDRTDEVLVPVIRDMNRREAEGTQSNITRYFHGAVGTGARLTEAQQQMQQKAQQKAQQQQARSQMPDEFAPRHAPRNKSKSGSSRRLAAAVSRLKAGTTSMEAAAAVMRSGPATRAPRKKTTTAGRKRKPGTSPAVVGSEDDDNEEQEDVDNDDDNDGQSGGRPDRRRTANRRGEKRIRS